MYNNVKADTTFNFQQPWDLEELTFISDCQLALRLVLVFPNGTVRVKLFTKFWTPRCFWQTKILVAETLSEKRYLGDGQDLLLIELPAFYTYQRWLHLAWQTQIAMTY